MTIVNISLDMKVAIDMHRAIVAELEKTSAFMHDPILAFWRLRYHLLAGKYASDNDALLNVSLLRHDKHLIARTW